MTPFTLGQRVEWKHSSGTKIFRGNLRGWIADKYYAWVEDDTGLKPRIVKADRLKHPTTGLLYLGILDGPA